MLRTSQLTKPAFNSKAESYDAHAQVQADAAEWLAEWLPPHKEATRCLEMGAGTGLFTQHLVDHFPRVESSDLSPEMLQICQKRVPGAVCRVRDAWAAPNAQESWDCLASSSLLQWAPCPHDVIRQWSDLVQAKGRLLLGFFAKPSLPEMMDVLGGSGPVEWRSPEEWGDTFAQAGYQIARMDAQTHRYHYESALHLWKSIHGTGATISRRIQPSAMLRFFRDYEASFRGDQGVYATWTFCRFELTAP